MQQAVRVADQTAFFSVDISKGGRTGYLVEMGPTKELFEKSPGRFDQRVSARRVFLIQRLYLPVKQKSPWKIFSRGIFILPRV